MAGAHWAPEIGYDPDRDPQIGLLNNRNIPMRHDSIDSLRGFLFVRRTRHAPNR
jgi:hypothetical protein